MKKKICVFIITILLLCFAYNVTNAENLQDLQQKRLELKEQIESANQDIDAIEIELTDNLEAINNLDEKIYGYEEQIQEIKEQMIKIREEIIQKQSELDDIEAKYEHQKQLLEERLVTLYEEGETQYLDVLLNSKSIVEFISNYYLIADIIQYDEDLLDSIEQQRTQVLDIQDELKIKKVELKTIKEEQEKIVISEDNAKVVRLSYVNNLTEEEQVIKDILSIYQQELDSVEMQILLLAQQNGDGSYVGGVFEWPVPGYTTITSVYGMRLHPIFKIYRMHSGIDIGAPMGSYVVAANAGTVIKSEYTVGYGNVVMIDHGGGITTVYGHASELLVNLGDTVERGDIIMKVGSTGWSTGPHLHFEIRVSGSTIDPYPYITTIPEEETNESTIEE